MGGRGNGPHDGRAAGTGVRTCTHVRSAGRGLRLGVQESLTVDGVGAYLTDPHPYVRTDDLMRQRRGSSHIRGRNFSHCIRHHLSPEELADRQLVRWVLTSLPRQNRSDVLRTSRADRQENACRQHNQVKPEFLRATVRRSLAIHQKERSLNCWPLLFS